MRKVRRITRELPCGSFIVAWRGIRCSVWRVDIFSSKAAMIAESQDPTASFLVDGNRSNIRAIIGLANDIGRNTALI